MKRKGATASTAMLLVCTPPSRGELDQLSKSSPLQEAVEAAIPFQIETWLAGQQVFLLFREIDTSTSGLATNE